MTPQHIITLRKKLNLTQAKAARLLGVQISVYCNWEQGIHQPSSVMRELIEALPAIVKHGIPPACKKTPGDDWSKLLDHSRGCIKCRRMLLYMAWMVRDV